MKNKICSKCKTKKSVNDFHRYKDGYQSICKACRKILDRQRFQTSDKRQKPVIVKVFNNSKRKLENV